MASKASEKGKGKSKYHAPRVHDYGNFNHITMGGFSPGHDTGGTGNPGTKP